MVSSVRGSITGCAASGEPSDRRQNFSSPAFAARRPPCRRPCRRGRRLPGVAWALDHRAPERECDHAGEEQRARRPGSRPSPAGATVYVTGRSTRAEPAAHYASIQRLSKLAVMPGNIDDTAEEVTRERGRGVAVRCDHTRDEEVRELFERVERESQRLDLLVNNAWGGHETFNGVFEAPFWEHPLEHWDSMLDRGVRNHLIASATPCRHGPPSVRPDRHHHVLDRDRYLRGSLFYDLAKAAMNRARGGCMGERRQRAEQERPSVAGGRTRARVRLHRRGWPPGGGLPHLTSKQHKGVGGKLRRHAI